MDRPHRPSPPVHGGPKRRGDAFAMALRDAAAVPWTALASSRWRCSRAWQSEAKAWACSARQGAPDARSSHGAEWPKMRVHAAAWPSSDDATLASRRYFGITTLSNRRERGRVEGTGAFLTAVRCLCRGLPRQKMAARWRFTVAAISASPSSSRISRVGFRGG